MTDTTKQIDRDAFERAAASVQINRFDLTLYGVPNPTRIYLCPETQGAYEIWLAARVTPVSPAQPELPEGHVIAPHYRGYACLGTGNYLVNHSAAGEPAELVISVATDGQKAGRKVGDEQDNIPGEYIQPDIMCVRVRFENVAGLDVLENQLRYLRNVHFAAPAKPQSDLHSAETIDTKLRALLTIHRNVERGPALQGSLAAIEAHISAGVAAAQSGKDEEIAALHRQLAGERLRADQGWQRYEAANADRNAVREQIAASVGAQVAGEPVGWEYENYYDSGDYEPHWKKVVSHFKPEEGLNCGLKFRNVKALGYTAPVPAPATVDRDAVLEEAAAICDNWRYQTSNYAGGCADQIRALKGKATQAERQPQPAAQVAVPEGWIEWPGGDCPLPAETMVEVRPRNGMKGRTAPAGDFNCWRHNAIGTDIVAYRVVPQGVEAQKGGA